MRKFDPKKNEDGVGRQMAPHRSFLLANRIFDLKANTEIDSRIASSFLFPFNFFLSPCECMRCPCRHAKEKTFSKDPLAFVLAVALRPHNPKDGSLVTIFFRRFISA